MDIKELLEKINIEATTWRRDGERLEVCLYYPNGQLYMKGALKNGAMDGSYEEYYENGDLRLQGAYKNGGKVGLWTEVKYVRLNRTPVDIDVWQPYHGVSRKESESTNK